MAARSFLARPTTRKLLTVGICTGPVGDPTVVPDEIAAKLSRRG